MKEFKGYKKFEGEGLKYFMKHHYRNLPWYKRLLIKTKAADLYISDDETRVTYLLNKKKPVSWVFGFFALLVVAFGYIFIGLNNVFNFIKNIFINLFNKLF